MLHNQDSLAGDANDQQEVEKEGGAYGASFKARAEEQLRKIDAAVDTVLYYARSENAQKDYLIKKVSLKRAVSDVAVKNREEILLHGIGLKTRGLDVSVMTDGKWLEYMLCQFLTNSIKYMSKECVPEIVISAEEMPEAVTLHFCDNGIGIPQGDLPYVFEKAFTGENGRVHSKSTGMGLYIVKNLCEKMGHRIAVRSVRGEFTEFSIAFSKNDFLLR